MVSGGGTGKRPALGPLSVNGVHKRGVADGEKGSVKDFEPEAALRKRNQDTRLGARVFTKQEQIELRNAYDENPYPSRRKLTELSYALGKPRGKLKTWFNNRRAKDRRIAMFPTETEESCKDCDEPGSPMTPATGAAPPANIALKKKLTRDDRERPPQPATTKRVSVQVGDWICTGNEGVEKGRLHSSHRNCRCLLSPHCIPRISPLSYARLCG